MEDMFNHSEFNGDIGNWDVSNVTNMKNMFYCSCFNRDISKWNVSKVEKIKDIFECPIKRIYMPKFNMNIISEGFDFGSVKKTTGAQKTSKDLIAIKHRIEDSIACILKGIIPPAENVDLFMIDGIYSPKRKTELRTLIKQCIKVFGNECSLNWIDVSQIKKLDKLFFKSTFNGDISRWNVSNAISMESMFFQSFFNKDISNWDVSNVVNMKGLFS
jgi:surface protein